MQNNIINFLTPKIHIKSGSSPSILKLVSVYSTAFMVVLVLLNFAVITNSTAYMRNKLTDYDEVLETELLMATYRQEEVFSTVSPINSLPFAVAIGGNTNKPTYLSAPPSVVISGKSYISIPKINVKAPIVVGTSTNTSKILKDLESGVLMYPGSAMPGQGSTVIVGHSSSNSPWNKYSNVFSLLNQLQVGDLIYISNNDKSYVYTVSNKKTGSVFSLSNADMSGDLVLSSCWPVGTDTGRILVSATLQN